MTKSGFLCWLMLLPVIAFCQTLDREVVGAEGESMTAGGLIIDYTVGEPMMSTATAGALIITEGFQQPAHMASDSVWPGDANSDQIANNFDLLAIGIGYGNVGPVRPGASLVWKPQYAPDWSNSLTGGTNYKHLDCDGDGIIQAADTLAINLNYGLTHNKTSSSSANGLPLTVFFTEDTLMVGDTAVMIISLGNDTLSADSVYGLAFSINYDPTLIEAGQIMVEYGSSWLGDNGTDMLSMSRNFELDGKLDIAMTRIDHQNRTGFGEVARLCIIMIDDISGKTYLQETFYSSISDPLAISADESEIEVAVGLDSLLLMQEDSLTRLDPALLAHMQVFPNPAGDVLQIQLEDLVAEAWALYNPLGQLVSHRSGYFRETQIDTRDLAEGIYTLSVVTQMGVLTKRIQILH